MNPLRKLAGQTAIYGFSSILGRLLNYLLVPIYTRVFMPFQFGTITEMYAYVPFLVVIFTYGMETAFFRHAQSEPDKNKVYSTGLISLLFSTAGFILLMTLFSQNIATAMRYPHNSEYIVWFTFIIALDVLSALPFAKLRHENKAKRFAAVKLINIFTNIVLNLFFLIVCPYILKNNTFGMANTISMIYNPAVGVGYVFISNLVASLITIILLIPEYSHIKYSFDKALFKKMLIYGLPLLIAGFAGIINETMDRVLLKYLLPQDVAMSQLGIYGACYKISIMMTIFIQAFRFAAEPFFFAQYKSENSKQIYADVMKYFIIACSLIFLSIVLYIDIVKYFVGKDYYSGLKVVPILLLANMCLGVFFNLSIWYKLTGQTKYGAYFAIFGATITLILNVWWIPVFGYMGAAWATLICYAAMMVLSFVIGQKYFRVEYKLKINLFYWLFAIILYFVGEYSMITNTVLKFGFNTILLLIFIVVVYYNEKKAKLSLITK